MKATALASGGVARLSPLAGEMPDPKAPMVDEPAAHLGAGHLLGPEG